MENFSPDRSPATLCLKVCRPLLMLTFTFNYFIGGAQPFTYHIFNILLHITNGLLLYCLIKKLIPEIPGIFNTAICSLFLLHPINTEAVSYISSRSDLMATALILSGFIAYLNKRSLLGFYISRQHGDRLCRALDRRTHLFFSEKPRDKKLLFTLARSRLPALPPALFWRHQPWDSAYLI